MAASYQEQLKDNQMTVTRREFSCSCSGRGGIGCGNNGKEL